MSYSAGIDACATGQHRQRAPVLLSELRWGRADVQRHEPQRWDQRLREKLAVAACSDASQRAAAERNGSLAS